MPRDVRNYSVGRGVDADIKIDDATVSRLHADLSVLPDGRVYLTDRRSTNGTHVREGGAWAQIDQRYVDPDTPVRLGDYETTCNLLLQLTSRARKPFAK